MARVVGIHGIFNEYRGPEQLRSEWLPALRDGLGFANVPFPNDADFAIGFYGELFRPEGRAGPVPYYAAADVEEPFEKEILEAWWREAASIEPQVLGPGDPARGVTPGWVQRALLNLCHSRFFAGWTERTIIWALKQVRDYLHKDTVRARVQEKVSAAVGPDTRVLIGHSLGSVVAYEALCAHPEWKVRTFVTLGSPLGIPNLIFHRLRPAPENNVGVWPRVERWFNISDAGDIVALEKKLATRFGERVIDLSVATGGVLGHDVRPYLTAQKTGEAVATGLAE